MFRSPVFALAVALLSSALVVTPACAEEEEERNDGGWTTVGETAGGDEELGDGSAWAALERLPPRFSTELGVQAAFVDMTYWREDPSYGGPFPGQGIRFGWGRNLDDHRLGLQTSLQLEGPVPLYFTVALEPLASWDWIFHNVQVGASVGPAFLLHSGLDQGGHAGIAPAAAVRMGWSQGWTRVGRRVFIVLEPKVRWMAGAPNLGGAIVIGQGRGR